MTRILILGSFAPSLCNFRGALIDALNQRGLEVHVAAPDLLANEQIRVRLEERGAICHDAPLSRSGLNPFSDFTTLCQLIWLMRRIRPDVFLGYTIKPVIYGLIAAWLAKVPKRVALITGLGYAFTGRANGLRGFVRRLAHALYRVALKHATLVFFQNSDDRDLFDISRLLPADVPVKVVAGSGVDISYFAVSPIPSQPMRFLLIARLLGDKGIREFAGAARKVRLTRPNVEFHLVGGVDPSPDGISEEEVLRWNNDGNIVWHGHLSDVRAAIADCHVYVLPSYREGTPRTVLEAMSMGRPIITTDAPGCRDTVVQGQNGFLISIQDATALAEAIEKFIERPELIAQMGAHSRQIAEEKYDVQKVNTHMIAAMEL